MFVLFYIFYLIFHYIFYSLGHENMVIAQCYMRVDTGDGVMFSASVNVLGHQVLFVHVFVCLFIIVYKEEAFATGTRACVCVCMSVYCVAVLAL